MAANRISETQDPVETSPRPDEPFVPAWTAHLLAVLDSALAEDTRRAVLKECSLVHYRANRMDELISPFRGDLPGFIALLVEKWHWKVTYDPLEGVILADENKPNCVCPLVQASAGPVSGVLCHCSEGFAERMFSAVVGKQVRAVVVRSILRGDPSCVYRIQV